MVYEFKYCFGNRYHTGDFDLNVQVIDPKTNRTVRTDNIFRTWEKVEQDPDSEWFLDDEVERHGYKQMCFTTRLRDDEKAIRYVLVNIFKNTEKWIGKK